MYSVESNPSIDQGQLNERVEEYITKRNTLLQDMNEKDYIFTQDVTSQQNTLRDQSTIKQKTSLSIDLLNSHLRLQNRYSDVVNQKKHKVSYNLLQDPIVVNMQAKSYENSRLQSILRETINMKSQNNEQSNQDIMEQPIQQESQQ